MMKGRFGKVLKKYKRLAPSIYDVSKAALWRRHELLECAGATDIATYDFSVPALHVCLATVQKIVSGSIRAVYQSARCQRKAVRMRNPATERNAHRVAMKW